MGLSMTSLLSLDPANYVPSHLHSPSRIFRETNCYTDIWIELLHACRIDPASGMSFACFSDFEVDQWTFFKPPPDQLQALYGIDVHEMQFFRPVTEHLTEHLAEGNAVIIEADSFYMPDTAGTSYRQRHTKSSIAIEAIDISRKKLHYFHGAGYHELAGEDYCGVLRLGGPFSEDVLPPYVEVVRFHSGQRLSGERLQNEAWKGLAQQLARKPSENPWQCFGKRLSQDLPKLLEGTDDNYHAYAFATVRQCGAAWELAKSFVEWLAPSSHHTILVAAEAFGKQAEHAKALLFKLARRKPFDPCPLIERAAEQWEIAMETMQQAVSTHFVPTS